MNDNLEERINLQKAVFEIEDANLFNRYELKQLEEFLSAGVNWSLSRFALCSLTEVAGDGLCRHALCMCSDKRELVSHVCCRSRECEGRVRSKGQAIRHPRCSA